MKRGAQALVTALVVAGLVPGTAGPRAASAAVAPPPEVGVLVSEGYAAGTAPGDQRYDVRVHRDGVWTRVTNNQSDDTGYVPSSFAPTLSPDGTRVAYIHCVKSGFVIGRAQAQAPFDDVCSPRVSDLDGSNVTSVTSLYLTSIEVGFAALDWGPAGEIAMSYRGELRAFTPGGSTRVVDASADHYWTDPSWSGDGSRILVTGHGRDEFGDFESGFADLYSVGAAGEGRMNLTVTPDDDEGDPTASPDGSLVALTSIDPFTGVVQMMASDGTERVGVNTGTTFFPDVVPVGWSNASTFLGLTTVDGDEVGRFGVVPVTNDQEIIQVTTLPNGWRSADWVGDVDSPPVAQGQELTVPGDGQVSFELVATDADLDPITFTVLTQPDHGTLTGTPPALTYEPADGYTGPDSFTFRATANGKHSATATVSITVTEPCSVLGTNDNDVLRGTAAVDVLCGFGGNDVLLGLGGNDVAYGGAGDDDLVGGPGGDTLDGGAGNDGLRGEGGTDDIVGGEGRDTVSFFKATGGAVIDLATQTGRAPVPRDRRHQRHRERLRHRTRGHPHRGRRLQPALRRAGNDVMRGGAEADLLDGGNGHGHARGRHRAGQPQRRRRTMTGCGAARAPTSATTTLDGGAPDVVREPDKRAARAAARRRPGASRVVGAGAPLGNDDYLWVYDPAETRSLQLNILHQRVCGRRPCARPSASPRRSPRARPTNALQAMSKRRVDWFLNRAAAWTRAGSSSWTTAVTGVNQFSKRWKVRAADNYFNHVAEAWVTPGGQVSEIETSDPDEVNGVDYYTVTC